MAKGYFFTKNIIILLISGYYVSPIFADQVAANGTTVTLNGGTASTTAATTPALLAINNGTIFANGVTATTTGPNAYGASATSGGQITFNGGSISTTGPGSFGIYAASSGVINANGLFINTTNSSAFGVVSDAGGTINLSGATIQTSGANSFGILAASGGVISGSANITTTNSGAIAVNAVGGQINYTGGSINTSGSNSAAFAASSSGTVTAGGFNAQTSGTNSPGASASSGGSVTITSGNLQTSNTGSFGATATGASSSVSISNASLQTSGGSAAGLVAQSGGTVSLQNSSLNTFGAGSSAVSLSNGGTVNVTNASAIAQGTGSYAVSADNSAGTAANIFNLTNSTLHSNQADQIHIDAATLTVNVNQSSINAGSTGVLVSAVNGGIGNINGNNSQFTGIVNAPASTVNMALTNSSSWTGSTSTLNNLTIDSTSRWNMNQSSTITGNVTLAGTININTPTPTQNLLVVNGVFTGQNGTVNLNTTLNGDSNSPTDVIAIAGTATGSTGINVNNFNGQGETTNQGILLVTGVNGGTVRTSSFYLANPAVAGPYEYVLEREGNNLYLRNTAPEGPDGIPDLGTSEGGGGNDDIIDGGNIVDPPNVGPGVIEVPIYRPEVSLMAAIPTAALIYDQTLLGNLHQRNGDTFYLDSSNDAPRKWIRYVHNGGYLHNGSIYQSGPDFDYQIGIVQVGVDLYNVSRDENALKTGLFGAAGSENSSVSAPFVTTAGHNEIEGTSLGAYATYTHQNKLYLDALVQATRYDVNAIPAFSSMTSTNGVGLSGSLETGYRFLLSDMFSVQPQAQFIAQTLSLNNTSDLGANIQFNRANPYAGRVGLLGEFKCATAIFDPLSFWLRGNYWHQFNNNTRTLFSSSTGYIPFTSLLPGDTLEAELGFTAKFLKKYSLYGTVSRSYFASSHGNSTTAIVGLNIAIV